MGVRKLAAWMGLVEDGRYVDDDQRDAEGEELTSDVYVDDEPGQEVSKVSQLPARRPTQLTPVAEKEVADLSRIVSVRPRSYNEARVIGENFRDGIPVIINLSQMSDADARRLIDFASGLSLGLYGRIERVTSKVFLLSPENVAISGDGTLAPADPEAAPFTQ